MAKNDFQYGGLLHPAMWNDDDINFVRWLHPAMWHVTGGSGMTCHWIRPNVRHIGILHLVSISTTSSQSTCHSAPISEILSKSDHPRQKKMTSCRFSRWRISAILDFMCPIVGSLKSPCTTSYRSSKNIIALNCLVFLENRVFCILATDRQTNEQMNSPDALSRSRYRKRRLNKVRQRYRRQTNRRICDNIKGT